MLDGGAIMVEGKLIPGDYCKPSGLYLNFAQCTLLDYKGPR